VVGLVAAFEATQNLDGFVDRRLGNINLLEATLEGTVLVEGLFVFAESRGPDAA